MKTPAVLRNILLTVALLMQWRRLLPAPGRLAIALAITGCSVLAIKNMPFASGEINPLAMAGIVQR